MLVLVIGLCLAGLAHLAPLVEQGSREAIPANNQAHYKKMDSDIGTYEFGYDTGVGTGKQSYRYENRTDDGRVYGKYGFIAPDGVLREVHYAADSNGFRTFLINRYPVKMDPKSFIGPIPTRIKFS